MAKRDQKSRVTEAPGSGVRVNLLIFFFTGDNIFGAGAQHSIKVTIINTDKPISERSKKLGDEANCSFCLCSLKTTLTFEVSLLGVREGDKKIKPCDPSPGL